MCVLSHHNPLRPCSSPHPPLLMEKSSLFQLNSKTGQLESDKGHLIGFEISLLKRPDKIGSTVQAAKTYMKCCDCICVFRSRHST